MPVLPLKVSTLMSPLVNMEKSLEASIAATGLPTVPGPAAVSQQMVASVESAIEQLPGPEQLAATLRLPPLPGVTPGAKTTATPPPVPPARGGKVI